MANSSQKAFQFLNSFCNCMSKFQQKSLVATCETKTKQKDKYSQAHYVFLDYIYSY